MLLAGFYDWIQQTESSTLPTSQFGNPFSRFHATASKRMSSLHLTEVMQHACNSVFIATSCNGHIFTVCSPDADHEHDDPPAATPVTATVITTLVTATMGEIEYNMSFCSSPSYMSSMSRMCSDFSQGLHR